MSDTLYQSEKGIWQMEVKRANGRVVYWSLRTRDAGVARAKAEEWHRSLERWKEEASTSPANQ